jgi:hypothetical protein
MGLGNREEERRKKNVMPSGAKHLYRNSKIDYYSGRDASTSLGMTAYWVVPKR